MSALDFVRLSAKTSLLGAAIAGVLGAPVLCAQTPNPSQGYPAGNVRDSAPLRFRPLGSPSAVDAYSPNASQVRQVSMMQSPGDSAPMPAPSLPPGGFSFPSAPLPSNPGLPSNSSPGGFALPPSPSLPAPLQSFPSGPIPPISSPSPAPLAVTPSPVPPAVAPLTPRVAPSPGLPRNPTINPNVNNGVRVAPSLPGNRPATDYMAIPQPQLETGFATMDNCRNITGPSSYRAASVFGCSPPSYGQPIYGAPAYNAPATYVPPPSQFAPAIALPPGAGISPIGMTGSLPPVIPGNPGYRPLISFGQEANPVQVGQGILGQPVAYVPGQKIRNALRYLAF